MLKTVNFDEARPFSEGETIYDVDGNAYEVRGGRAVLTKGNTSISYFLGRSMSLCFSRTK